MITVVCWKWTPRRGYRSTFGPETVNTLRRMVARQYPHPHRFVCVTDSPEGIDPDVIVLPDFGDFTDVPSPHGGMNPSCYRRLRLFHPDAAQWFGNRFVSLDLDVVITGDLTSLWHRAEDIVLWGDTNPTTFYNGSMLLMTAGARRQVWDDFDPMTSPAKSRASGQFGSDQGRISHRLGRGERTWSTVDGVYSYRIHVQSKRGVLPSNARVVFFHGQVDPWSSAAQALPWVRQHYNLQSHEQVA